MKRLLTAVALLLATVPASADVHGAWTALDQADGTLHLRVMLREWNMFGSTLKAAEIPGLAAAFRATTGTAVQFQLRREAGTIAFEGTFKNGDGGGQFTFTPNGRYLSSIRATGVEMDMAGDKSEEEMLLSLAISDLTVEYIRSLQPLFPDLTLREARRARSSSVTPQYVKSMRDGGLEVSSAREAARLAESGVTPSWLREMREAGVNITTAREASRVASVGITPKYVAELAAAGYKNLSVRDLTRLAANGINAEFIAKFRSHQ